MIYGAIKHLFPGIQDHEFLLQDDGDGPYIARWDRPEPRPTDEQIATAVQAAEEAAQAADVVAALQLELDRRAQQSGYDNILSACSYAAQPQGAPFQAEGAAFLAWRSAVWAEAYAVLAEVQAGQRLMPTAAEAVAAMPALNLP